MDKNAIDLAMFEIQQMVSVSILSVDGLMGSDTNPAGFQMPATDANLLEFSLFDIEKRIKALRALL